MKQQIRGALRGSIQRTVDMSDALKTGERYRRGRGEGILVLTPTLLQRRHLLSRLYLANLVHPPRPECHSWSSLGPTLGAYWLGGPGCDGATQNGRVGLRTRNEVCRQHVRECVVGLAIKRVRQGLEPATKGWVGTEFVQAWPSIRLRHLEVR